MEQYISKSALVAEIERRQKFWHYKPGLIKSGYAEEEDKDIIAFIDTLEVKEVDLEKEPASEDLEKKERDESDDDLYAIHFEKWNITGECPSELEAKIDAKFGITGRDSNGKPSNGYCDWKKDVFTNGPSIYSFVKLGMDYQREQMMKDAIEAPVSSTGIWANGKGVTTYANIEIPTKKSLDPRRDKVKVIIIKD